MPDFPYQTQNNNLQANTALGNVNYWSKGIMSLIFGFAIFTSSTYIFPQATPTTISTIGQITDFNPTSPNTVAEDHYPIFTFQSEEGQSHSVQHQNPYTYIFYSIGDQVEVSYDPANPAQAWIKNDPINNTYTWLTQIIGGYYLFLGLFVVFLKLKDIPNNIIGTLKGGVFGLACSAAALLSSPHINNLFNSNLALFSDKSLDDVRTYLPWIAVFMAGSGVIIIILTVSYVRSSLMKHLPPTI